MDKSPKTIYSFAVPPAWLLSRRDYTPWSEGRQKAFHQVEGFYRASAPSVCDNPGACRLTEDDRLALKLFTCWLYHWESAGPSADGRSVAESISAGRGFARGGNLGGNPLFDLVHADALCAQQNRAAERFTTDYGRYLRAIALKIDRRNTADDDLPGWWTPFYMHLTGIASENAKPALDSFRGYSGLKNWLRIALGLFLRRFIIKERGRETAFSDLDGNSCEDEGKADFADQIPAAAEAGATPEEWKTLSEHLILAFRQARSVLSAEDWTRLFYHFGEKLQNQQIARLYGEDGSTTTRRRESALLRFRAGLDRAFSADPVLRELGDEVFTTWGREVADLMSQFFKSGGEDES